MHKQTNFRKSICHYKKTNKQILFVIKQTAIMEVCAIYDQ